MNGILHHIQNTTSTQNEARRLLEKGVAKLGDAVIADVQTRGRGRFGRTWISPNGGLYATFIMRPESLLSLKAGLALVRVLGRAGVSACLKWPNDVMIGDRKIAGVLIETTGTLSLVGIGLNLMSAPLDAATCVSAHIQRVDRYEWVHEIGSELMAMSEEGFDLDAYRAACLTLGHLVRLEGVGDNAVIEGMATDVDNLGRLSVMTADGTRMISSGECFHLRTNKSAVDLQTKKDYFQTRDHGTREIAMTSILEQAIHLETSAEKTYRDAAQATSDSGAAKILGLLADEESDHAKRLRGMGDVSRFQAPDLIQSAKMWIRGAVEGGASAISLDANLLDVLQRAMTVEQMTESFYREHAQSTKDDAVRDLFLRLADAERNHFLLVGSLIEYFNRPNEWVESAEFGHRDEY